MIAGKSEQLLVALALSLLQATSIRAHLLTTNGY